MLIMLYAGMICLLIYLSLMLNVGYYTRGDLFGPVSKFPRVFLTLGVVVGLALFLALQIKSMPVLALAIVLLLLYFIALPIAIERYYVADVYDATQHLDRTLYIMQTGKSSATADPYFEIQPGFFYATAMFFLVTGIPPLGMVKWFPAIFFAAAYVPILVFFGRNFFKSKELPVFLSIALLIMWSGRYHYSAQVYSLPLLILAVALIIEAISDQKLMARNSMIALMIFPAIVITHQLVALATSVTLLAIFLWSTMYRRCMSFVSLLAITFLLLWTTYFLWLSALSFGNLILTIGAVADLIATEGLLALIAAAIARSDPLLQQVLLFKALFTAFVEITGSVVLAYGWVRRKAQMHGMLLLIMIGVGGAIYLLGFPLGGRGYVERVVLITAFLTAVGLTRGFSGISRLSLKRLALLFQAILLVALTVTGTVLFNSSRNYQFVTHTENSALQFAHISGPQSLHSSIIDLTVADISRPDRVDYANLASSKPNYAALIFTLHRFIEQSYMEPPDFDVLTRANQNAHLVRAYSNGISSIFIVTGSN
jgi:hypothetical protein